MVIDMRQNGHRQRSDVWNSTMVGSMLVGSETRTVAETRLILRAGSRSLQRHDLYVFFSGLFMALISHHVNLPRPTPGTTTSHPAPADFVVQTPELAFLLSYDLFSLLPDDSQYPFQAGPPRI